MGVRRRIAAIAVLTALALVAARTLAQRADQPPQVQTSDPGISAEASAQIEALLREKDSRSPAERKIDSQLLYARRMQQGLPIADGVQTLDVNIPYAADGHVIVDVRAKVTPGLLAALNGFTSEVTVTSPGDLQLHADLADLDAIAAQPDVVFVQPKQGAMTSRAAAPAAGQKKAGGSRRAAVGDAVRTALSGLVGTGQGAVTSQSDITHRTAVFRGLTGVTGAGVKIGVLSDGVTHLAAAQASGDLGAVTVLPGQTGSFGDEGTSILEVIHDVAPGAQLYFATAYGGGGIAQFAQNIRDLRTAGCDIIVDDAWYFVETPFQDGQGPSVVSTTNAGVVTQAVKDVAALGAMYFSAAGNFGNLNDGTSGVWEGDFVLGAATVNPPVTSAGNFHSFTGVQDFNTLTASAGGGPINLFWSDPLGGSSNDYDLFRLNSAGTTVVSSSTNIQSGTQDPYEEMSQPFNSTANPRIVIVKKTGAAGRFLHLNTNGGRLSVATAGQTHGHAATSNIFTFGVAATYAINTYPNPFNTANVTETFSSDGPRKVFFLGDGTPVTPGNFSSTGGVALQKPDLTAADGVLVSGAGDFSSTFLGTSAAAANAAAIMALFKSQNPGFTQSQLRTMLLSTALDIEAPGVDRDSGIGIVMAQAPQPACTFTIAPPTANIGAAGGTGFATVTSSAGTCNWVAWSNVAWINVSGSGVGTGNGLVNYSVPPNPGPARSGTIMAQGGQIITVSQAGTPAMPFDTNTPLPIADNTTQESSLTVSGVTGPITNVSASFYLTHTSDADLTISLIGPDSTTVKLTEKNGGSADNYGSACTPLTSRTTFDDSAATFITSSFAPFVGSFRPEQPLSALNGKAGPQANGTWKLRIVDSKTGDTGTLLCWSLYINQGPPNFPPTISGLSNRATAVNTPIAVNFTVGDVESGPSGVSVSASSSNTTLVPNANVVLSGTGALRTVMITPALNRTGITAITLSATDGTSTVNQSFGVLVGRPVRPSDFDGDGRADTSVFRPSNGTWYIRNSLTGLNVGLVWGGAGDVPVVGDYDGDGVSDMAVFRPSNGTWYLRSSINGSLLPPIVWGGVGDVPAVGDYDGDGLTDATVFRPSNGTWYVRFSSNGALFALVWGGAGDVAAAGDYDGDGLTDLAVFRSSNGTWYLRNSTTGAQTTVVWGGAGDIAVPGDYDADGRTDTAVFRASTGIWYIRNSSTGLDEGLLWGGPGDVPVPGDYDGDGKTDMAVFRPSNGTWYLRSSIDGGLTSVVWGGVGDIPILRRQ